MNPIQSKLPPDASTSPPKLSLELQVQRYNTEEGYLRGQDCRTCRNKGYVMVLEEGYLALQKCACQSQRQSLTLIERSGLKHLAQQYRFDNFVVKATWQQIIKDTAQHFADDPTGHWFYIGGQVGSGKTHLCTAIVNALMAQGHEAKYLLWRDEIVKLKASAMDLLEYAKRIAPYKSVKVLYIDDLFKSEKGKSPTTSDINIAFEILNARYQDPQKITLFSSEKTIRELMTIDEAIASRIYQMTQGFYLEIKPNPRMNQRLHERKSNE